MSRSDTSALTGLFWRVLPGVRPRERGRLLFFMGLSALLSLAQTLGLAGAEALFLGRVGVEWLPLTLIGASVLTVLGSFGYGLMVGRKRNDVSFIWLLGIGAGLLGLTLLPAASGAVWVFPVLLCIYFLAQAVLINHYWTFTGDYFDTLASKRIFPLLNIGNSFGGFAGGFLAVAVIRLATPEALVLAWAATFLGAAALVRMARRPLRRWGPLELEEHDETSVEGMAGAVRYIRASPMARWLVLSTLGMVLSLFVAQYVYSDLFLRAYPTTEELAVFLALYLGITNLVEIAIEVLVTPRLIQRLGVSSANLVHPLLTLLSFTALIVDYRLGPAVAARVNKELLENALAQPVRALVYNALPARFRGRLRLFQEGIVFYGGMAVAGGILLALGPRVDPIWLCISGAALAAIYLGANLQLRAEYLRTLTARLREGRLDLRELGDELGGFEVSRLASLWGSTLESISAYPSAAELELPALLVERGVVEPVARATTHPNPRVRAACVEALEACRVDIAQPVLLRSLEDDDASVRLAAVRTALRARSPGPTTTAERGGPVRTRELDAALEQRLSDPEPAVRAEAAAGLGQRGQELLARMSCADDPTQVREALQRLPVELLAHALERTEAEDAGVRAAALQAATRLQRPVPLSTQRLTSELEHPDARVRRAAVDAIATRDDPEALDALGRSLDDTSRDVRRAAERALGTAGEAALAVLVPRLRSGNRGAVEGSVGALASMGLPAARAELNAELRQRVSEGWQALRALDHLEGAEGLPLRFLNAAYADRVRDNQRTAFRILEQVEDARVMRTVASVLRFASARARGDALEVLSNLGDREVSRLLVLMLEGGPVEERLAAVAPYVQLPASLDDVLAGARSSEDRWVQLAVSSLEAGSTETMKEETMERLLVLRQIALFEGLSLEQLEAVNQITSEARYLKGEVVCREGDLGRELYLVLEGLVGIYQAYGTPAQVERRRQPPASYFGDIAILADHPRTATAVALEDTTLLVLNGDYFKDLILERPEIAFEIFRALTTRLLDAEERARASDAPSGRAESEG